MRKRPAIPRILKIQKVEGHKIYCMFNNGEDRLLDFAEIFRKWNVSKDDPEFILMEVEEFRRVGLRNFTLSWSNISVELISEEGKKEAHSYELSPDELYRLSSPVPQSNSGRFGDLIKEARKKAGLTQQQLAERSGTSRFYISRVENNRTDVELSTFRRIVEAGLGKRLKLLVE